jgi:D-alanyl-D-alanine dipeptidase
MTFSGETKLARTALALLALCMMLTPIACSGGTGNKTATPTPAVTPSPVATPKPVITPPVGAALKVRAPLINFRSSPNTESDANIIGELPYEHRVIGVGAEQDFVRVFDPASQNYGYIQKDLLVGENVVLYAQIPNKKQQKKDNAGNPVFAADGVTPVMEKQELVDIRLYAPNVKYEFVFATENNYMGRRLYARSIPILQLGTAKKLKKAADLFAKDGYTIVLADAYRPLSVQRILYDKIRNGNYVANPATGSDHNRGAAVDMMLMDKNGNLLEMPTPMMTLNETANRGNPSWTPTAKANVDYMTNIMRKAGFFSISTEWWHFADNQRDLYMISDYDFATIRMIPKDWFKKEGL